MRIGRWVARLFHRRPVEAPPRTPVTPAPRPPSPDVFEPTAPMRVSLGKVSGYSELERRKLDEAARVMERVFNSREFRDEVLARPGFADDARTPAEVYQALRAAKEHYTDAADGEVDLNVRLESFSWFQRHVVGYTTASSDTVTTNRRFFSGYEPAEVAGHLAHEWLHTLGFSHDHAATRDRPNSVPYALGDLVERLARGPLTPL